jgi:hypothetical protein
VPFTGDATAGQVIATLHLDIRVRQEMEGSNDFDDIFDS